jgi:apolipoprotein D and lipocalin family protein
MKSTGQLVTPALALAAGALVLANVYAQDTAPPTTVEHVELERYVGLWHEIARIPNSFQKSCRWGVTAEYALRTDGRIDVINRCHKSDGKLEQARGVARIEDRRSNARLKVSFFSIFGWRPVWGDYWIIGLDDGYRYAIVGTPNRKYGWILSRDPQLDDAVLDTVFVKLREQGYAPDAFQMTAQTRPGAP